MSRQLFGQRLHDALDAGDLHAVRAIADELEMPELVADEMIAICETRAASPLFGRHLLGNLRKAREELADE